MYLGLKIMKMFNIMWLKHFICMFYFIPCNYLKKITYIIQNLVYAEEIFFYDLT